MVPLGTRSPRSGRVAGENDHPRYHSQDLYKVASEPKQFLIVPGADHVDLYALFDKVPVGKLAEFFAERSEAGKGKLQFTPLSERSDSNGFLLKPRRGMS